MAKTIEDTYKKVDQREHVLLRPGMYIGEIRKTMEEQWVFDSKTEKMTKRAIEYSPGFIKIVDEILTNATDHAVRDPTVTAIKVGYDRTTGEITVWNNGKGIPVVEHKDHNIFIPEMIFGNLLTSSNYDDTQQRVVGGVHGLGSKLTNIYSSRFSIETVDAERGLKYRQEFTDNMSAKSKPKITKCSTKSYTQISFVPDYPRFRMKSLDDDTVAMIDKRVYDCIACSEKNVQVYLNERKLKGKSLLDYIEYYQKESTTNKVVAYERYEEKRAGNIFVWEFAVAPSDKFEQVSFVNGINTTQGGKHVDAVMYQITSKLKQLIETKKRIKDLKPAMIKERMFLFLRATVCNPTFNSQTKEYLTTASKDFGCRADVPDKFIEKLYKSSITEEILEYTKLKESLELAKQTDGKKRNIVRVPKLEDAIWAGTSKSNACTLILTEGDSAKTFAMWGRAIVGADKFGVFPLRGKVLNVRDANNQQLLNNAEINNIKQILGLKQGKTYDNTNDLRYGRLLILTDSDVDGSHIKGLIINMFHYWWPALLKLNFIHTLRTPIVKAFKGQKVKEFFTQQDFEQWEREQANARSWNIRYFKGLGTSKRDDAKDCFKRFDELKAEYYYKDARCDESILLAFEKDKGSSSSSGQKYTDKRKEWLSKYDRNVSMDIHTHRIPLQDFIHKDLIHFSNYDNLRSIPSLCDGLKPSQRKILYYCLKRKIFAKEIKVAQLSGYVSAETSYHHGENSLQQAIISMAQDFVGSNNVSLLQADSNFGSRYEGGKDAASPRYIFTKLSAVTGAIFDERDNAILNHLEEDGQTIEPDFFVPIIPMVLVNGCEGIGTGYSTYVPPHCPKQVAENVLRLLDGKQPEAMVPYFRGFKGTVERVERHAYVTRGKYERVSDTQLVITELPVNTWVTPYKEYLESLTDDPPQKKESGASKTAILKDVKNKTTDENNDIRFIVEFKSAKVLDSMIKSGTLEKELKLVKPFSSGNMYLFDEDYSLAKYRDTTDILMDFYEIRLDFYAKRKAYLIKKLSKELEVVSAKVRFINEYLEGTLDINRKSKDHVNELLVERGYPKQASESDAKKSFDYLTSLPISTLTLERIEALTSQKGGLEQSLRVLHTKTEKQLWKDDIAALLETLN